MDNVLGKYTDLDKSSPKIEDGYIQWVAGNNSIAPNNSERLYFKSIVNLYQNSKEPDTQLMTDFQSFVENIRFLFKNDVNYDRLRTVDFTDKSQVRVILPLLVSKIKEITEYYKQKRRSLKNEKTRLFINGTKNALEISLYNLLNELSHKNPDSEKDLSSNNLTGINVEYVQLYDLFEYYNSNDQSYVRNLEILSKNPIFFNIVEYLEQNPSSEKEDYDQGCNNSDVYDFENKIDLSQRYTSCFLQYLSGFDQFNQKIPYERNIEKGENFFHWISGENLFEKSSQKIDKTSIHDLDWSNATSSGKIQESDIIFVDGPEGRKAAWLKNYDSQIVEDSMEVVINKNIEFRYPFPDHGLSGEGFAWTGAGIKRRKEDLQLFYGKDFDRVQKEVDTLYWNTTSLGISSCNDLLLNDSTIVESGAFPSDDYEKADKMDIRLKSNDDIFDGVYNDSEKHLWLFDFRETEIPILPGSNNIYWPLTRYESVDDLFFEYKWGDSVELSSIDVTQQFVGAIASTTLSSADRLYRLKTYCGPETECAWLKSIPLSAINPNDVNGCNCDVDTKIVPTRRRYKTGAVQNSVYFKAEPNTFSIFNLAGLGENSSVNLNDIKAFRGKKHDATCQYSHEVLNDLFSISKFNRKDVEVNQWKKCNCKSIKYSPFGHRGDEFTDFGGYTDFIVKHTSLPKPFNFKTWKGSDGKDYKSSKDFAWFKLLDSPDKNIGWGEGIWITSDGAEMVLNEHDQYLYYRTSIDRCEGYDPPYGIFKHSLCSCKYSDSDCRSKDCIAVWMKAEKNENGEWVEIDEISDMSMDSNNFYRYDHQTSIEYSTERLRVSGEFLDIPETFEMSPLTDSYAFFEETGHSMDAMSFVWNCPITNARPYWTESSLNLTSTMIQK